MSLRALRTLVAIAHHGTFARAGDAVGLTQSAVSLQVKSLEAEFGVQLFDRSHRQPVLTEAGHIVLTHAREVLALYDRIPDALSDERTLVGRLRLGAIQTGLAWAVPEALVILRRLQPKLRVHLVSGMSAVLAQRVAAGELDAAITSEPVRPHPPDLVWSTLYTDRFWILAPPGHQGKSLRELVDSLPFIRFDAHTWAGRMIDRELRQNGIIVREEMALDSQTAIIRMVASGLGMAVINLSRDMLADLPDITLLPFGDPQMERRVVLLEHDDRPAERFTRAFKDAVEQAMIIKTHDSGDN